jgi:hypothetical protein
MARLPSTAALNDVPNIHQQVNTTHKALFMGSHLASLFNRLKELLICISLSGPRRKIARILFRPLSTNKSAICWQIGS